MELRILSGPSTVTANMMSVRSKITLTYSMFGLHEVGEEICLTASHKQKLFELPYPITSIPVVTKGINMNAIGHWFNYF